MKTLGPPAIAQVCMRAVIRVHPLFHVFVVSFLPLFRDQSIVSCEYYCGLPTPIFEQVQGFYHASRNYVASAQRDLLIWGSNTVRRKALKKMMWSEFL